MVGVVMSVGRERTEDDLMPLPDPELRTAHDVRKLRACYGCSKLGSKDSMISMPAGTAMHGRCFIAKFGIAKLLQQPREETDKLTLVDIGGDAMRRLIEARAR